MKKIIIYVSYDPYEYINYFHLIIDDKAILSYCPDEKKETILDKIIDNGEEKKVLNCILLKILM